MLAATSQPNWVAMGVILTLTFGGIVLFLFRQRRQL